MKKIRFYLSECDKGAENVRHRADITFSVVMKEKDSDGFSILEIEALLEAKLLDEIEKYLHKKGVYYADEY